MTAGHSKRSYRGLNLCLFVVVPLCVSGHVNFDLSLARQSLVWPNTVIFFRHLFPSGIIFYIWGLSPYVLVSFMMQIKLQVRLQFIMLIRLLMP